MATVRATAGKEKVDGELNLSLDTVDTVGNGATRRRNVTNGKEDSRCNLEYWNHTRRRQTAQ